MTIIAILAVDEHGAIGKNGRLPWKHNADDMKWFMESTKHQIVCMGRKTWESPDMIQPLPRRKNIIFTRDDFFISENRDKIEFIASNDISTSLHIIQNENRDKDVFVIGGKEIYWQSLSAIEKVYMTLIPGVHDADTFMDMECYLSDFVCEDGFELGTADVEIYSRRN